MMEAGTDAPVLIWFRHDLRLFDHPALLAAIRTRRPVIPVHVLDDAAPGAWRPGGAARWWLHHSLSALGTALKAAGSRLILRRGPWAEVLPALVRESGAVAVHAGRLHEPWARAADGAVAAALPVPVHFHRTATLFDPETMRGRQGTPFTVYTPFARACLSAAPPAPPEAAPERIPAPATWPRSETLAEWDLLPDDAGQAQRLAQVWTPGEAAAQRRLADFVDDALDRYAGARDHPGTEGTSRLSPHLRWGEVSPATVWHAAATAAGHRGQGLEAFQKELLWREFAIHLLRHHPHLPAQPLSRAFAAFPWRDAPDALRAWQEGRTGYPTVDAGMRQLRDTGWMHNRVRMITASFLVKHLLLPWQAGARWFWERLVDADLAANSASWQWVAGSASGANPFFRIFNPLLQGERFDPDGRYVRRHVPELAQLPDAFMHRPWEAPAAVLAAAGVTLGRTYPPPMVDHGAARRRALDAFVTLGRAARADEA